VSNVFIFGIYDLHLSKMWGDFDEEARRIKDELDNLRRELARVRIDRLRNEIIPSFRGPRISFRGPMIMSRELLEKIAPLEEPLCDVYETEDEVVVIADVPGSKKEDITVTATEDTIEISAQFKKEEEVKKPSYLKRERRCEKFYRKLSLPTKVNPEGAKSKYNNGILEVRLPKAERKKGFKLKVD